MFRPVFHVFVGARNLGRVLATLPYFAFSVATFFPHSDGAKSFRSVGSSTRARWRDLRSNWIYIYIYIRAIQVTGPVAKPQAARRARHPELTVVCQPPGRSPQEHGLDFGRRPQHEGFSSCTQGPRRRPKAMRAAKDPVR